jgi:transcriptional regulator
VVYLPPHFTEDREGVLIAHIERHDFGLLVTHGTAGQTASQVPFLVERRGGALVLQAHLARGNPQVDDLDRGGAALAIFTGPHAYVSPSWYGAGPAVPTWNYTAVHAYGEIRAIRDPDWLRDLVGRLSDRHEAREPTPPWRIEELPEAFLAAMLNGIVGVEIAVGRLEGKFKLSQNRPAADRPRIAAALARRDDVDSQAVARLMRARENLR